MKVYIFHILKSMESRNIDCIWQYMTHKHFIVKHDYRNQISVFSWLLAYLKVIDEMAISSKGTNFRTTMNALFKKLVHRLRVKKPSSDNN